MYLIRQINMRSMNLLKVARSYYDHGSELIYSSLSNTFLSGGELYDVSAGMRGRIDCSTFIHLLLQGISYEESPYATGNVEDFFDSLHPDGDPDLMNRLKRGMPARYAYELANYYVDRDMAVFTDTDWKSGDLLFFRAPSSTLEQYKEHGCFMEISHVAIVAEDTDYIYESTGSQLLAPEKNHLRPGVVRTKISEKRAPLFYVRIT